MSSAPTDCRVPDPTDAKADGQFQAAPRHRDGYGSTILPRAMDRARRGWMLTAAEAAALVAEIERLHATLETLNHEK